MKLYIIRHGETAWNVEGRLQGQSDTELNENGVRLAKVTAEGLKNIPFDLGISSPLRRAKHTSTIFTEIRSTSARRETERRSRRSATGQKRSIMS